MENMEKETQAQAVNQEQNANVSTQEVAQEDIQSISHQDDFKTSDDQIETKDHELPDWVKERLARERRAKQREKERADALEERLRVQYQPVSPIPASQEVDPVQVVQGLIDQRLEEREKIKNQQEAQKSVIELSNKLNRGFEKYDDYGIIFESDVPITPRVREFLETISNPDDFTYNLVKYNRDKLQAISRMHGATQSVELDKLYKGFSAKTGKKVTTNAPTPPSNVSSSPASSKNINQMSYEERFQAVNARNYRKRK